MIPNQHTDKCCGRIPPVAFPGVIFFAAAVLIFLSSCASSPDARRTFSCFSGDSIAADIAWEELGPGFSYTEFTVAGRGAVCRCVRLDLDTPGTQAGCIPDIKEPAFRTFSPRQLEAEARRRNFSVALNTNPFEIRKTGGKKLPIPVGIIRSDGNERRRTDTPPSDSDGIRTENSGRKYTEASMETQPRRNAEDFS